jgi:hypothetical protein
MSSEEAPLVVTSVAGRRRGRVAFAAWLAAIIAVVTWVLAAGIGSERRDGRSAIAPGAGASQSAPGSSTVSAQPGSSRPVPAGSMELIGPRPSGTVWLRSGNGARSLDLSTGEAGRPIDTSDWRDRILSLPDGRFLCVCVDVTSIDGGERAIVSLADVVGGQPSKATELVTVEGRRDEGRRADEQGYPVVTSASLSPDGHLAVVGVAARRPPSWEQSLIVVDVPNREVVQTIGLAPVPDEQRTQAWAPRVRFSSDGQRALVSLTVVGANGISQERHFVAWIQGHFLPLEAVAGFGTKGPAADGRCLGTSPALLRRDTVFGLCHDANGTESFVRSVALDTGRIRELALDAVLKGSFPMRLVDRANGLLYLWDPFSHRVARVSIASAKLDAAAVIEAPTAVLEPLDRLARTFSAWIAPPTLAKIMLEPSLALSSDGRTLYVVAMSGDRIEEPGSAATIHVLDAGSLALRATWTVESNVVSIAIAPNGADVIVGLLGEAPELVAPEASVILLNADTGKPRARYHGLGTEWPMLIEPSDLN